MNFSITSKKYGVVTIIVDDNISPEIFSKNWYLAPMDTKYGDRLYVKRNAKINGKKTTSYLHREIMGNPKRKLVDHINGNTLDNRIENLRICDHVSNCANRRPQKRSISGIKGVQKNHSAKQRPWRARIGYKGTTVELGFFKTKEEAASAYSAAAKEMYGEFAYVGDEK